MNEHSELVRLLRSISDDLTTMLRIMPIPGATGNCTAPIGLYSLTSMSFIGYLVSPEELSVYGYTQRIMACVEYSHFNKDVTEFGVKLNHDIVTQLYDGLVFSFVPIRFGIGRGLESFIVPVPGRMDVWSLDVNRLAHALVRFIRDLENVMLTDDDLCARMWERLMSLKDAIELLHVE